MLDRLGQIVAIVAGVIAIVGTIVGIINTVERPHVWLQIRKDKNRIPPALLAQLNPPPATLMDYEDPQFGSVTVTIANFTDKEVSGTLELGGLVKLTAVEVIDSQLQEPLLKGYKASISGVKLERGDPCPVKNNWPDRPDVKLDLPIPALPSYGGHITLAVYGVPADKVDACLNGASADMRYCS